MPDPSRLIAVIEPIVEQAGAELVDLEVAGSHGRPVVRAYVDTDAGITLDECARLSRLLEAELERLGTVPQRYVLEVSSPGIDRPLRRREHFERFVGQEIDVRLYVKREGRKKYVGTLERVEDAERGFRIIVRDGQERWTVAEEEIARARLHVRW